MSSDNCLVENQNQNSERETRILVNNYDNQEIVNDAIRENYDTLNRVYNIFEKACLISIIISQILLIAVLIQSFIALPFYAIGVLCMVTVISISVFVNLYIRMKVLLDNVKGNRNLNIGVILTYSCFNIAAFNVLIFLVLLSLKETFESMNSLTMTVISIPLYLAISLGVFYFFFILPALYAFNLWSDILLYAIALICSFALVTLIDIKIDTNKTSWISVSYPLLSFLSYYIIYSILSFIDQPKEERREVNLMIQLIGQLILIVGAIIFFMNKERIITIRPVLPIGLICLSGLIITIDKLLQIIRDNEETPEDHKEENDKIKS